ncbi:MAG: dihydrofolate reductase [Verrucomicrobiota bacterium]
METRGTWIAVVAMNQNRVIGKDGQLPWHLPEDLQFFKKLTVGGTVIMGRKTYESIGRPLPKRRNLVLSRSLSNAEGVEVFSNLSDLNDKLGNHERIFVIGGGEIYRLVMPYLQEIYLSLVEGEHVGDAHFPLFEEDFEAPETVYRGDGFSVKRYSHTTS